jgi:hypothetical protein
VLGYYFEKAGIPTTQISLVREHSVMIRPPRALFVPFELGRPLGAPGDAAFQTRVLQQALDLLARMDGPVLEDFPDDAPISAGSTEDEEGWACPISLPAPPKADDVDADILAEIDFLRSWHDISKVRHGGTSTGVSQLGIDAAARFLAAYARGETPDSPVKSLSSADLLRLASEDLKAYYAESVTAQPGHNGQDPGSQDIANWFWGETKSGNMLLALRDALKASDEQMLQVVGGFLLVPYHHNYRQAAGGEG